LLRVGDSETDREEMQSVQNAGKLGRDSVRLSVTKYHTSAERKEFFVRCCLKLYPALRQKRRRYNYPARMTSGVPVIML